MQTDDRYSVQFANLCFVSVSEIFVCAARLSMVGVASMMVMCAVGRLASADEGVEFFETRIRPVLVESCYRCHNSHDTAEAGLALDSRAGIRATSEHGTVVVPGDPEKSLLLRVLRHEIVGLEMPDGDAALAPSVVSDFKTWIRQGAVDPRDHPPAAQEITAATSWESVFAKRKQWWSLQPIVHPAPPDIQEWSSHPVDRFIYSKMSVAGLTPSDRADRRTLLRRLTFALTGLPPAPDQLQRFLTDERTDAYERMVDELLDSPSFGERWARHWMDWIRYSDTHGSEGDPAIPYAYQYRDYLIRALNADVPYDQLVLEHVAGDLLPNPRLNEGLGINESAIGTAQWRFVFHGFAPTDALDEKVRFTDDQINVFSKMFLGLTVSCARCHDHKFDAISQADYYAIFGILASSRPALLDVNLPTRQLAQRESLLELKQQIRSELGSTWLQHLPSLIAELEGADEISTRFRESKVLSPWVTLRDAIRDGGDASMVWQEQCRDWQAVHDATVSDVADGKNAWAWDLANRQDYATWFARGNGLVDQPMVAGDFVVSTTPGTAVAEILPSGVHTHRLSSKHRGFLGSPRIKLDGEYQVWMLLSGEGRASARYVVQNYPRDGTVYPIPEIKGPDWYWQRYDVSYWQGEHVHFELATAKDAPIVGRNQDRSSFGVRNVIVREKGQAAPHAVDREYLGPLYARAANQDVASAADVINLFELTLNETIEAWLQGAMTNGQALFLNRLLREELLPNGDDSGVMQSLVSEYRRREEEIPMPTRVPGVVDANPIDQPLFERGDHKRPLQPVKRRFLSAVDDTPYVAEGSGRLELAFDVIRTDNPLTARVLVNRLWHHLFGAGIVRTPDNFGKLGAEPTHPQLLDFIAGRFQRRGWSIKDAIRLIVTSKTWQQASAASAAARETDPENLWLSHANLRRLDAEAIRDSLFMTSGRLDRKPFGPGFPANSKTPRRSVYVLSRRNSMDRFLQVFDSPLPFATVGRRSETNVPAQSLAMLNDSLVVDLSNAWAEQMVAASELGTRERIVLMFESALGRPPTQTELNVFVDYVDHVSEAAVNGVARRMEIVQQIASRQTALERVLEPTTQRLIEARSGKDDAAESLRPFAWWRFDDDFRDAVGKLHGTPHGQARIEDGALVLDGKSYLSTSSLPKDLRAKTLEVWVQLDDLTQRGGAPMSLQTENGIVFDAVVFGERRPQEWLAGSNVSQRTLDFDGDREESNVDPVHVAIVYEDDGTIRAYRNGVAYGRPIRKSDLQPFIAGDAQILFGLRHGPPANGRFLKGRVLEARLYGRALLRTEVEASWHGHVFVSDADVLSALSTADREFVVGTRQELEELRMESKTLERVDSIRDPWRRLAHAIFNLKEMIYVR